MTAFRRSLIVTGLLLVAGGTALAVAYGFTAGTAMALGTGGAMTGVGRWFDRFPQWLRRTVAYGVAACALFFAAVTILVVVHGCRDTARYDEDCVVVLGCGIRGEKVLPTLQARLDKCLAYKARNPDALIVVSGGRGPREGITEAEAMRRYLVAAGVDPRHIVPETQARNTIENIRNAKILTDSIFIADGRYSTVYVTSDYHLYRTSRIVAATSGTDARYLGAGVRWYLRPGAYCREALSVVNFWLFE